MSLIQLVKTLHNYIGTDVQTPYSVLNHFKGEFLISELLDKKKVVFNERLGDLKEAESLRFCVYLYLNYTFISLS